MESSDFLPKNLGLRKRRPSLAMLAQVDLDSARVMRVGFGVTTKPASLK